MASFAYAKLSPIEGLVSQATIDNQTDSVKAQDTYAGDNKLYGAAMYDSGLGIYGNKKLLDAAGVTYPKDLSDVWTADQFQAALEQLAAKDKDKKVLDLKENYGGEWPTYGFYVVNSTGNVVVKDNKPEGNLNNPSVVKAVEQFAGWRQYVDPNSDDKAFTQGRVALSWVGHWLYNGYERPSATTWSSCRCPTSAPAPRAAMGHGRGAWGLQQERQGGRQVPRLPHERRQREGDDRRNAAPPGTKTVIATSPLYKSGGPLQLFAEQLADLRPEPADQPVRGDPATDHPGLSRDQPAVLPGLLQRLQGRQRQAELDKARKAVDLDYKDNDNYGLT